MNISFYLFNNGHYLKYLNSLKNCRRVTLTIIRKCNKELTDEQLKPTDDSKTEDQRKMECPEEPTTCCMSGCANCVWLDYAEKLTKYYCDGGEKAVKELNEKITDQNIKAFLLHELKMKNIKTK